MSQELFEALSLPSAQEALGAARKALSNKADPNATMIPPDDFRPQSALNFALRLDRPWAGELALALIDAGANPVFNEAGHSALLIASRFGRRETVEALLSRGHSARAATKEGWTAFLCAAAKGDFELCERLAPLSNVMANANDGAKDMRVDAAGLFIKNGKGAEALAAYQAGWGDPGLAGNSYFTPLTHAILDQDDALAAYLAQRVSPERQRASCSDNTPAHYAVERGRVDYLRLLARHGHELNGVREDGMTPLMSALALRRFDAARALLELGADPALRMIRGSRRGEGGYKGLDALCAALASQDPEGLAIAEGFASRCDPKASSHESKNTALHYAARIADKALSERWVRLLLDLGWSANALDGHKQPPLMHAMDAESFGAMEALFPVTDLRRKNKSGLDAWAVGEWLATKRQKPAALGALSALRDKAALSESAEPAGPKRKAKAI